VNPANGHSGLEEVKQFSEELKNDGFKIWITLHYSDTWADPGHQQTPALWESASFDALKDSVYTYTKKVVCQIQPDYIQIGNEINSGFLHPYGNINNVSNFKELLQKGIAAVRDNSNNTKIVLHYAGFENASWFFQQVNDIYYDIIGLSYYPIWHGKSITNLKDSITTLSIANHKEVIIAETAYPFTLNWNDWTNNIVGLESQLILPDFPATEIGQKNYVNRIHTMLKEIPNSKGIGFCYWGGELIAWRGSQATDGSAWENQALFDFQNHALPALEAFNAN
jgi:arabinogalactan endo-1,4-beta-galactosidase